MLCGKCLETKDKYMNCFMKFLNFYCSSQSKVSKDNRKVSTFLHSNVLFAVAVISAMATYLDCFLNNCNISNFYLPVREIK